MAANALASKAGSSRLAGVKLMANRRGSLPASRSIASRRPARSRIAPMMKRSSSMERSVSMAADTIEVIDCGSIGICGRNRHSYSCSSPVASSTIGWNATRCRVRRLKK